MVEGEAGKFASKPDSVTGLVLVGRPRAGAGALVLTTGTFLRGMIHIGARAYPGRPSRRAASPALSASLLGHGFALGRLKTGTPPRLDGTTIDWTMLERQPGDDEPEPFSFLTPAITSEQVDCFITRTTEAGHDLIRANIGHSPVYSGAIAGRGPRYCPSIEDKVMRFADRETHQIFLEPEGRDVQTIYPNGISTALPAAPCRSVSCAPFRALPTSACCSRARRSNMISSIRAS